MLIKNVKSIKLVLVIIEDLVFKLAKKLLLFI